METESAIKAFLITLDLLGAFAFAVSGASAGIDKRIDIFGILVLHCRRYFWRDSARSADWRSSTGSDCQRPLPDCFCGGRSRHLCLVSGDKEAAKSGADLRCHRLVILRRHWNAKGLGVRHQSRHGGNIGHANGYRRRCYARSLDRPGACYIAHRFLCPGRSCGCRYHRCGCCTTRFARSLRSGGWRVMPGIEVGGDPIWLAASRRPAGSQFSPLTTRRNAGARLPTFPVGEDEPRGIATKGAGKIFCPLRW